MANYSVDPIILKPFLPYKTELDSFEGRFYVSLVGFMFENTRILKVGVPFHMNFPEINLRFYVRYLDGKDWKRGVVFIKEIVPRPAISFVANLIYKEKCVCLPVKYLEESDDQFLKLNYQWKFRNEWNSIAVKSSIAGTPLLQGSAEEFITEHFWGYAKVNANTSAEYEVSHPRWNIHQVKESFINCNFSGLYGSGFESLEKAKPDSVFLADGSPVTVYKKTIISH